MSNVSIELIVFAIILFSIPCAVLINRIANARKLIREHAEARGWKVIKIKLGWWDFILTYLDETGLQNITHYGSYLNKVVWQGETKGLQLDEPTYKAKSKSWLYTSIIFGICFLVLFVGYEYDQISWNLYRYSFAENGYAVRVNRGFAVGVDSIIRGEEALRLVRSAKPTQDLPADGKEFLILNLKVKNISRKAPTSWDISIMDINTKLEQEIKDDGHNLHIDLPVIGVLPKLEDTKDLAFGETRVIAFVFEATSKATVQNITICAINNASYEFPEIPFTRNPFRSNNFVLFSYFLIFVSLINSKFSNRWHFLLEFKKTRGYIFVPLVLLTVLLLTSWISSTRDYLLIFIMLVFYTIAWSNIILLTTTKMGSVEKI